MQYVDKYLSWPNISTEYLLHSKAHALKIDMPRIKKVTSVTSVCMRKLYHFNQCSLPLHHAPATVCKPAIFNQAQ